MTTYTVKPRQTIYDAVINATGTMEAVMAVALANGISITELVAVGTVLVIPEGVTTNRAVAEELARNRIVIGTLGMPVAVEVITIEGSGEALATEDNEEIIIE